MRLLILGGTTEATALADALAARADVVPTLSLAGRTARPTVPAVPFRVGGFGGSEGLAGYLEGERVDAVIDATHPFAARISAHAVAACERTRTPLARFTRPPWTPRAGDRWQIVSDLHAAAEALGPESRRVFLTTGRLELGPFRMAPQHHYLLRTIDAPPEADLPRNSDLVLARGPFVQADEESLMRQHRIDVLVSKNSGGGAGMSKLDAARELGLPVVMVERPPATRRGDDLATLPAVLHWIEAHRKAPSRFLAP